MGVCVIFFNVLRSVKACASAYRPLCLPAKKSFYLLTFCQQQQKWPLDGNALKRKLTLLTIID
jgi:hypothetical protein